MKTYLDKAKFMIQVARGIPIDLVDYIFNMILSKFQHILTNILPFRILMSQFLLFIGILSTPTELVRQLMGPIDSITLARSVGHLRFYLC